MTALMTIMGITAQIQTTVKGFVLARTIITKLELQASRSERYRPREQHGLWLARNEGMDPLAVPI